MENKLVSINIITLGRNTLYKTLETILNQDFAHPYEINLILQGTIDQKRIYLLNKKNLRINIHTYNHGLGFGYYRNEAIKKSNGDTLVRIDDDEWTKDSKRLDNITKEILDQRYTVLTAGVEVQLGKGYWTDCISLLGYPGGGALGFKKLWSVDNNQETQHLCSGNFAFNKIILNKIGLFQESLKSGAEDIAFAEQINKQDIKILYKENATVYHIHRSGFISFCKWHFLRGKSAYEFNKLGMVNNNHKKEKIKSIKNILLNVSIKLVYIPGVWFMFFAQYLSQIIGIIYAKTVSKK